MAVNWKNVDQNTKIRVVFYGRVSTEHEMQLEAFKNQTKWYYDCLDQHPNWILAKPVETYLDKGITGTQAKKRQGFMKMIEDAQRGLFDMIVTKDVSRFARNTVDTLEYSRKLTGLGVQIYFVRDNIRTIQDNDGEFRLTIMASLAQSESGKTSERVKTGQYMSRKEGVLMGSGNVLGYNRVRKVHDDDKKGRVKDKEVPTFAIDPEQAETVRMIFDLYEEGLGLRRIQTHLLKEKRLNSSGECVWHMSTISRILENPIYTGKQRQHQTEVEDFLTGRKKRIPKEEQVLIEGDFEPIISQEQFERVQVIKARKEAERIETESGLVGKGGTVTSDKWVDKLECGCGSRFRKYNWYTKKDQEQTRGYACSNRVNNGSLEYRIRNGLYDPEQDEQSILDGIEVTDETGAPLELPGSDICSLKTIPDWHLELMAKKVFSYITGIHREQILATYEAIAENYVAETEECSVDIGKLKGQIDQYSKKSKKLIELYTDGLISKEDFQTERKEYTDTLEELKRQLHEAEHPEVAEAMKIDDLNEVLDTMITLFDFSKNISPEFLKHYVDKIIVRSDHCYEWMISLRGDSVEFIEENHINSNETYAEKRKFSREIQQSKYDTMFTDTVNFDEAREYRKAQGTYLRANQWENLLVVVHVRN